MAYELDLAYSNQTFRTIGILPEFDQALHNLLGMSESSGSGFGSRDMQWRLDNPPTQVLLTSILQLGKDYEVLVHYCNCYEIDEEGYPIDNGKEVFKYSVPPIEDTPQLNTIN